MRQTARKTTVTHPDRCRTFAEADHPHRLRRRRKPDQDRKDDGGGRRERRAESKEPQTRKALRLGCTNAPHDGRFEPVLVDDHTLAAPALQEPIYTVQRIAVRFACDFRLNQRGVMIPVQLDRRPTPPPYQLIDGTKPSSFLAECLRPRQRAIQALAFVFGERLVQTSTHEQRRIIGMVRFLAHVAFMPSRGIHRAQVIEPSTSPASSVPSQKRRQLVLEFLAGLKNIPLHQFDTALQNRRHLFLRHPLDAEKDQRQSLLLR